MCSRWSRTAGCVGIFIAACGGATQQQPPPDLRPTPVPSVGQDEPETPWSICVSQAESTGDPVADVERIGRMCGAEKRQRALSAVRVGKQTAASATDRYTFRADGPGSCYRAYVVGGEGVSEVVVELIDPSGKVVGADETQGVRGAAPHREPLCVTSGGIYTVEVSITEGGGEYALQVWTHGVSREGE